MAIRPFKLLLLAATLGLAPGVVSGQPSAAPEAAAAPWDLGELYPSAEAWSASYQHMRAAVDQLGRYRHTLGSSAESMRAALSAIRRSSLKPTPENT